MVCLPCGDKLGFETKCPKCGEATTTRKDSDFFTGWDAEYIPEGVLNPNLCEPRLTALIIDTWHTFPRDENGIPQFQHAELAAMNSDHRLDASSVDIYATVFSSMTAKSSQGLALARKHRKNDG